MMWRMYLLGTPGNGTGSEKSSPESSSRLKIRTDMFLMAGSTWKTSFSWLISVSLGNSTMRALI